jgi:GNAT superfamily N-acetyltransferase
MMPIRRATLADAAAIRDLTRSAYAKWVPLIGREPKPMGADYDAAVRHHLIELLFLGDTLAGLAEMIPQPDHLMLENLAVAPAHQGQGLGRQLMARVEAVAAELGHAEIRLYTNARFAENIALYRRLGYRLDREEVVPAGNVAHMSKRLG